MVDGAAVEAVGEDDCVMFREDCMGDVKGYSLPGLLISGGNSDGLCVCVCVRICCCCCWDGCVEARATGRGLLGSLVTILLIVTG